MPLTTINQELESLRQKMDGRDILIDKYNEVTLELAKQPKGKEHYEAILKLNEQQQELVEKLKANKKLRKTYLDKLEEKGGILKNSNPAIAKELSDLEDQIADKENLLLYLSESVTAATKILNELGKIHRQKGKAKAWGVGMLMGKLLNTPQKNTSLKNDQIIISNIRKLTRQYKKALSKIDGMKLTALDIKNFVKTVDHFLGNPSMAGVAENKFRNLVRNIRSFEATLLQQLEQLEDQETCLEKEVKTWRQDRVILIEKA